MKTKIIYISGNEVFDMSEIRAAFDEVRSALGLGNDTILFGVPVDKEDALEKPANQSEQGIFVKSDVTVVAEDVEETDTELETQTIVCPQNDIEPTFTEYDTYDENSPCEEMLNTDELDTNDDAVNVDPVSVSPVAVSIDIVAEDEIDNIQEETSKVIPILSVLAQSQVTDIPFMTAEAVTTNADVDMIVQPIVDTDKTAIVDEFLQPSNQDTDIEKITIDDIVDDAPVAPVEKTLEQLLESMTPLREDVTQHFQSETEDINTESVFAEETDTDATLAQLASEFAENEDKIELTQKSEPQGKIGKLKNILPFKKAKRDDTGLMGDLFGWAGIAANDDDFSIPGFFTGVKKQGA